jgi:hypothetical protein
MSKNTTKHFLVVYQYGKVASTSIVSSFNNIDDVEAVQAHFLGFENLSASMRMLLNTGSGDYFLPHRQGQLMTNMETTRRINAIKSSADKDEHLSLITLCREPLKWLESCILQDIEGYLPFFRRVSRHFEPDTMAHQSDEDFVRFGLNYTIENLVKAFDRISNIDDFLYRNRKYNDLNLNTKLLFIDNNISMFFNLAMRPNSWFNEHYCVLTGNSIFDLKDQGSGLYHSAVSWADLFLLRYEDLDTALPRVAETLGLADQFQLVRENISVSKRFFEEVRTCFQTDAANRLGEHMLRSGVQAHFGYRR